MARPRRPDRAGLLFLGTVLGFALTALVLFLYVRSTQRRVVTERVALALGLPEEAFELERVYPDGALRIALRGVAFLDSAGDTLVSAPTARGTLDAASLNGTGPITIRDAEVVRPFVRLAQDAAGEWNVFGIVAVEAEGQPVGGAPDPDEPPARPLAIRGLRIVDGRVRVALPLEGPPEPPAERFASLPQPETRREGGRWVRISWLEGLDATLPLVRVGGDQGWRVEVARASARVRNPDTRIVNLAGWMEDRGDLVVRFGLRELRTTHSRFAGTGTLRTPDPEGPAFYDLRLRADPLDFRDLAGMGIAVPAQGTATFDLALRTLDARRTRFTVTDARVAMLDSRISGRLTAVTGGAEGVAFSDTRLALEPLRLDDLAELGYLDALPVAGEVRGTVASAGEVGTDGGALRLELAATLATRDGGTPVSTVTAAGPVRWTADAESPLRLDGVRVEAAPLYLETLAGFAPDNAALLRGAVRGGVTLTGGLAELRFAGGELAYQVGGAPESRVQGLAGFVAPGPPLRYRVEGRADPLALATLTELFPALPFRPALLSGPFAVAGNGDDVRFEVDLDGPAGAFALRGSATLGEVPAFDVAGRVEAFRPGALTTAEVPLPGPVTGTFSARGSTEDLRFRVDLAEGTAGRFALAGSFRQVGGGLPPVFDVAGRVDAFRVGAVLGRPELLPDPVSGPIRVSGGGRQPYRFDVDLRGAVGRVDVEGFYQPGEVPAYAARGEVSALDVSALPGGRALPDTRLSGSLRVEGRGTTAETFNGIVDFQALPGSTVGRFPLETGVVRLAAAGGVLRLDTLAFAIRGARLDAAGQLGLSRPAPEPLRFSLVAAELAALRPLVPRGDTLPDFAGSVRLAGTLTGTLENPALAVRGDARGLRWAQYAAGSLELDVALARAEGGWSGRATLEGATLQLGTQSLASLRLQTEVVPGSAAFSVAARRDGQTEVAAAGTLEMEGLSPTGALLDTLALRLAGTQWELAERARLGWGAEGFAVENVRLRRVDGLGYVEADGTVPTRGEADLRMRAFGIQLGELRGLSPSFPAVAGRLAAQVELLGPVDDPQFRLDVRVDSLAAGDVAAERLVVTGRYEDGGMQLTGEMIYGGRRVLDLRGTVPMRVALGGTVPTVELVREGPLAATLVADSLPLALLASATQALEDVDGVARARVEVSGTPADPVVGGFAQVWGGAMTVVPLGVRWTGMAASASLEGEEVRLDSMVLRSRGGGFARAAGRVVLDDPASPQVDLRVVMDNFRAADNRELAELQLDTDTGAVYVSGRLASAQVSGMLGIEQSTIYIPGAGDEVEGDILAADVGAIGADTVTVPTAGAALLAGLGVQDLEVVLGDNVWLQSPEARIQIGGRLTVNRQPGTELPVLFGQLTALRGQYTLAIGPIEREFDIVSGVVEFFNTPELNPSLDILAEYEARGPGTGAEDVRVQVQLGGTLQNPTVQLSAAGSRQPLSESEAATLLVFGQRIDTGGAGAATAGALSAEFLQSAVVDELFGAVLVTPLERVLLGVGFDYVRVRSRPTGLGVLSSSSAFTPEGILNSLTLEVGKELVDDVFLTLEASNLLGSTGPRPGVSVDWEITPTLGLRAAIEPVRQDDLLRDLQLQERSDWQVSADARWRFEYGRPPQGEPVVSRPRQPGAPGQASTPTGEPPPPPPPDAPTP